MMASAFYQSLVDFWLRRGGTLVVGKRIDRQLQLFTTFAIDVQFLRSWTLGRQLSLVHKAGIR